MCPPGRRQVSSGYRIAPGKGRLMSFVGGEPSWKTLICLDGFYLPRLVNITVLLVRTMSLFCGRSNIGIYFGVNSCLFKTLLSSGHSNSNMTLIKKVCRLTCFLCLIKCLEFFAPFPMFLFKMLLGYPQKSKFSNGAGKA